MFGYWAHKRCVATPLNNYGAAWVRASGGPCVSTHGHAQRPAPPRLSMAHGDADEGVGTTRGAGEGTGGMTNGQWPIFNQLPRRQ